MKRLRTIFLHVDIYVAVIGAILIAIYSFGFDKDHLVSTVTLASISVILISIVGLRARQEEVLERLPLIGKNKFLDTLPEEFQKRLRDANELWISGVHQHELFTQYMRDLERFASRGKTVMKVLLVPPNGAATHMTAMRFRSQDNLSEFVAVEQGKVRSSLHLLACLRDDSKNPNVSVRVLDFMPSYGIMFVNPNELSQSVLFIEHYTFRTRGGARKPKTVHFSDDEWYGLAKDEFEEMWKASTTA